MFKKKTNPKVGDVRVRSGFLFFPKTCSTAFGRTETKWFKFAKWDEIYIPFADPKYKLQWIPRRWVK